jgi:hypothetical protein
VPGCRHAVFVDVHHLDPRADGGGHHFENLLTLCAAHHRAVHRGKLVVLRGPRGELRFQHADGSDYGAPNVSPVAADAGAKAFQALRTLGFRESESKHALSRALSDVGREATTETLLRRALGELHRSRAA